MTDFKNLHQLDPETLRTLLDGESIGVEDTTYHKPLSEIELADRHQQFTRAAIEQAVLGEEFKVLKEEFKKKLEPVQARLKENLEAVRTKGLTKRGKCYKVPDYDKREVHIIDEDGYHVLTRAMYPEERQLNMPLQKSA